MPAVLKRGPSDRLPRDMTRRQEVLLYRARVGTLTAAGGMMHGIEEACPLCEEQGQIGRNGATIEHIVRCLPRCTDPPVQIDIQSFWVQPSDAAELLDLATAVIKVTPLGHQRAADNTARFNATRRNRRG